MRTRATKRLRTWVWTGASGSAWVAELEPGRYLHCDRNGATSTYSSGVTPKQGRWGDFWEEVT